MREEATFCRGPEGIYAPPLPRPSLMHVARGTLLHGRSVSVARPQTVTPPPSGAAAFGELLQWERTQAVMCSVHFVGCRRQSVLLNGEGKQSLVKPGSHWKPSCPPESNDSPPVHTGHARLCDGRQALSAHSDNSRTSPLPRSIHIVHPDLSATHLFLSLTLSLFVCV